MKKIKSKIKGENIPNIDLIKLEARKELARREFFFYCHLKAPKFYKKSRKFLVDFCNDLQDFYESDDYNVLIVNIPPRHGKSRTLGCFVEWIFGKNKEEKVMTGTYNEILSRTFSKNVRDSISEQKVDEDTIVYNDIFPDVTIKKGDGAQNLWSLDGGYNNYLATSPGGTATGFGASIIIIDDLIKSAEEAYNENAKEKHFTWFTDTMLSRLEEGGKIIVVMTRWASDDLAGRLLEFDGFKIKHINLKALQDDGTMLCDEILSRKSYELKLKAMGADIASANYQQEPIDIKGRLYQSFKTYDKELPKFKEIRNYTDTADTGADYLCSITYGKTFDNEAYVLDVIYTKEPMEVTEEQVAKSLFMYDVNRADIESNNGGRSFARNVERILKTTYESNKTHFNSFHQSNNKASRIYSNSAWVMNHIYFPANWKNKWNEYYNAMIKYQAEGKNKHDDAPDATTGVAEMCVKKKGMRVMM